MMAGVRKDAKSKSKAKAASTEAATEATEDAEAKEATDAEAGANKEDVAPSGEVAGSAAGAAPMEDPLPDSELAVSAVSEEALLQMLLEPAGARGGAKEKEAEKEATPQPKKRRRLSVAARREINMPPPMMKASYYLNTNPKPEEKKLMPLDTPLTCNLVVNAAKQSLMRSHGDSIDADHGDDLVHRDLFQESILPTPTVMPPPSTGKKPAADAPADAEPGAAGRNKRPRGPMHFTFDEVSA